MNFTEANIVNGYYFSNDLYFAADFQNYLRTQTGSTTTINIIICTVDYLLRLQVQLLI